jgi:putative SOS response-associated peptidase YedK
MCGRFTQNYTWEEVHEFLSVFGEPRNLQPRYNIAPTTTVDVIRRGEHGRELAPMRWWLIPGWWKKSMREVPSTFNARAETVATSPMFRDDFKSRRGIIPASGFYEWTGAKGQKQPHLFTAADGAPILAFAGLWDRWRDPASGDEILSCTIIVTGASAWMQRYHDRMPVLLAAKDFDAWLDGTPGPDALGPAHESALREWLVSPRLNRTGAGDDDPTLIAPIDVPAAAQPPASLF